MKKTSVYMDDTDVVRSKRLADLEGRSQAEVVRAAIAAYEVTRDGGRQFSLSGVWSGEGSSIYEVQKGDLLLGFGR